MTLILWITTALLVVNAAHSYILLTANLEDVHAIAKQLADSPVADQIKRIWRRASNQFNAQVAKAKDSGYQKRANEEQETNSVEENPARAEDVVEQSDGGHTDQRQEDAQDPDNKPSLYLSPTKSGEQA